MNKLHNIKKIMTWILCEIYIHYNLDAPIDPQKVVTIEHFITDKKPNSAHYCNVKVSQLEVEGYLSKVFGFSNTIQKPHPTVFCSTDESTFILICIESSRECFRSVFEQRSPLHTLLSVNGSVFCLKIKWNALCCFFHWIFKVFF